jgi:hypothetical protein
MKSRVGFQPNGSYDYVTSWSQPLPPTLPEPLNTSSQTLVAYSKNSQLEKAFYHHSNCKFCEKKLIHARILGYLIREGRSIKAREHVAQEVNPCLDDDQINELGKMYFEHYIRVCESPSLVVIPSLIVP